MVCVLVIYFIYFLFIYFHGSKDNNTCDNKRTLRQITAATQQVGATNGVIFYIFI